MISLTPSAAQRRCGVPFDKTRLPLFANALSRLARGVLGEALTADIRLSEELKLLVEPGSGRRPKWFPSSPRIGVHYLQSWSPNDYSVGSR